MTTPEEVVSRSGGLAPTGEPRDLRRMFALLAGHPAIQLLDQERHPAGEIRLMPNDAGGVYHDLGDDSYWLFSPQELEHFARTRPCRL